MELFEKNITLVQFWPTVRSSLGYDVSFVCRLSAMYNACIVTKLYVAGVR